MSLADLAFKLISGMAFYSRGPRPAAPKTKHPGPEPRRAVEPFRLHDIREDAAPAFLDRAGSPEEPDVEAITARFPHLLQTAQALIVSDLADQGVAIHMAVAIGRRARPAMAQLIALIEETHDPAPLGLGESEEEVDA